MKRLCARLGRDRRGMVAIEFAIMFPVLLTMLIGSFEITYALLAEAKLRTMTHAMAGLIARQSSLDAATISDICTAGALMMKPLSQSALSATITSVSQSGSTIAVDWQDGSCGSDAPTVSDAVSTVTSLLGSDGDSAIVVRASFSFQSPTQLFLPATLVLTEDAYARPLNNQTVSYP